VITLSNRSFGVDMRLLVKAAIFGAITEAIVWLDLLVHPVGQGPMAMPDLLFTIPHLPAMYVLQFTSQSFNGSFIGGYPEWLGLPLLVAISWALWTLPWAGLLVALRKCRTMRSSELPSAAATGSRSP